MVGYVSFSFLAVQKLAMALIRIVLHIRNAALQVDHERTCRMRGKRNVSAFSRNSSVYSNDDIATLTIIIPRALVTSD